MIMLTSYKWRICIYSKERRVFWRCQDNIYWWGDIFRDQIGLAFCVQINCYEIHCLYTECQILSSCLEFCYILLLLYGVSDSFKQKCEGTKLAQHKVDLGCVQLLVIHVIYTIPVLTGGYAYHEMEWFGLIWLVLWESMESNQIKSNICWFIIT